MLLDEKTVYIMILAFCSDYDSDPITCADIYSGRYQPTVGSLYKKLALRSFIVSIYHK
jgi:hypothetical protein